MAISLATDAPYSDAARDPTTATDRTAAESKVATHDVEPERRGRTEGHQLSGPLTVAWHEKASAGTFEALRPDHEARAASRAR